MSQTYSQTLVELFACGASLNTEGIAVIYDNGKEKQNMTYTQLVNAVQHVCYPSRGLTFIVNKSSDCVHFPAQSTRTHVRLKGPTSTRPTNSPMWGVAPLAFQLFAMVNFCLFSWVLCTNRQPPKVWLVTLDTISPPYLCGARWLLGRIGSGANWL